jgi:hypothetical protein
MRFDTPQVKPMSNKNPLRTSYFISLNKSTLFLLMTAFFFFYLPTNSFLMPPVMLPRAPTVLFIIEPDVSEALDLI